MSGHPARAPHGRGGRAPGGLPGDSEAWDPRTGRRPDRSGRRAPGLAAVVLAPTALAAALALGGCSLFGGGQGGSAGPPPGGDGPMAGAPRPQGDGDSTTDAAPDGDTISSLGDSVRAVLDSARAAGDTAAGREEAAQPAGGDGPVAEEGPSGPVLVTDVDSLASLGPVFTPYDVGPVLQKQGLEGLLRATVLPVIRKHELPPDEWARFWVLVNREGRVVRTVEHLGSGHAAFDDAARAVTEQLRYRPAVRDEAFVPVWILVRVSLLMG